MTTPRATLLRHVAALTALFVAEVVALLLFQAPEERFPRYIGFDSGIDLTMQDLIRRGLRPTIDFGCIYGALPLLINRAGTRSRGGRRGRSGWKCSSRWA